MIMRSILSNPIRRAALAIAMVMALCLALGPETRAASDVEVVTLDGARYDGGVAAIDVREGAVPAVQVSFSGRNGASAWSAAFAVSAQTLLGHSGRVTLAPLPPSEGVGIVALGSPDDP